MLPGPQAQQGQKTKIAWEPGQHHSALGPPQHRQSQRSPPRDPAAPAGGAPADAGTVLARKSGAGQDETGMGSPAPDTGEGRDAERDAVRAAASLRDGTREPGKPPMRVRPKPQDCPAGTAPTEQRGMGCPPTGAGPDRTPTDAPPPGASTDCARSAGCAGPGAGDILPPGASTDCACPAGCAGPGTGEVAPPAEEPGLEVGDPAPAVARGNFVETPQFGHQVVTEPDSSRGRGWPSRTGKAQRKGNPSPTPPPTPGEAGRGRPAESTEPTETHGAPPPSTPSGGGEGDSTSDKNSNSPSSTSETEELPWELRGIS
uniref:proline-rich protein HaeIII subfamily 1-like n=1 Tax=Agelaius phoeniceus TaxID=39638 RepID=UPI0023EADC62|nr:proline-rich protein HaeIII subfamily 1-like [Agelaius phoeniceus]